MLPADVSNPSSEFTPAIMGILLNRPSFNRTLGASPKNVLSSIKFSIVGTKSVIESLKGA